MNKNSILKIAFLFIISTACTFKAKAQFTLTVTNGSGCAIFIEVLDNSSNVLYSVTTSTISTPVTYTCVGTSGIPSGIRYTEGGFTTTIIPVGANNHPLSGTTGCLVGFFVDNLMTTSGTCLPPGTPYLDTTTIY